MSIEEEITKLLKKRGRMFMTLTQLRDRLPMRVIRQLGHKDKKVNVSQVRASLLPYLGGELREFKGPRSRCIGLNLDDSDLVLRMIQEKPGLSSKRLRQLLPLVNAEFMVAFNSLHRTGRILFALDETSHIPCSIATSSTPPQVVEGDTWMDQWNQFKKAYEEVAQGKRFVRIHQIRQRLLWSPEIFNGVLRRLRDDYDVQLQGGDPALMTPAEIEDSFIDEHGRLRLTITWIKNDRF